MLKYLTAVLILCSAPSFAQPDYDAYNALLGQYVSADGRVDYPKLKANRAALDAVAAQFSAQQPSERWSREEQMAFWINAYNLFTLRLIVDHYPLKSIMDLDGGKTWDLQRITIGGTAYSLNQIENEILRPRFKDPRIHFAINCAARSCPPLYNQAFRPQTLQQQLDARTRRFIRSKNNVLAPKTVKVSKIFEWYAADFGALIPFLNRYASVKIEPTANVSFLPYDWNLND